MSKFKNGKSGYQEEYFKVLPADFQEDSKNMLPEIKISSG